MHETDILLNSLKQAYFLFSRQIDGTVISVSDEVKTMLGYDTQEFKDLLSEKLLLETPKGSVSPAEYDIQLNHKNGSARWFKVREIPVINQAGETKAYDCIVHDITSHKISHNSLLATEKSFREALGASIKALAVSVESRDVYSCGHHQRASAIARIIAQELGLTRDQIDTIRLAAVIHDIGKITVPLEILNKTEDLNDTEFGIVQGHSEAGYLILKDLDLPAQMAEIVLQHHERLDGSGYPNRIKGEQILPETRVLTVADVIEAMASNRAHRPSLDLDMIINEVTCQKGTLYDPDVVDISVRLLSEKKLVL
jgi:PAS domain S-box-containing protein